MRLFGICPLPNAAGSCPLSPPLPHLVRVSPSPIAMVPALRARLACKLSLYLQRSCHSDGQIQWFFRTKFRSRFVHLFIDSTYVPGLGLDTKNIAGTMELKFIVFQWNFAASLHLWPELNPLPCAPQTLCLFVSQPFLDISYFTNLFLISFKTGTVSHLSLYT